MSKRYDDRIEVEWDRTSAAPLAFTWRGRSYAIDQNLGSWREANWGPGHNGINGRSFEHWRVLAHPAGVSSTGDLDADGFLTPLGAVYDLLRNLADNAWRLVRVWD